MSDNRCGSTKETEWGTARCMNENCSGWHHSSTPFPGQLYSWYDEDVSPREKAEQKGQRSGKGTQTVSRFLSWLRR